MGTSEEKLITLNEASKISPFSADYLSLLVRKEKLEGFKKDGKWFTTKKALNDYTKRVAEASYNRQETLNVKIPAVENQKALTNLKWALALAAVVILGLAVWGFEGRRGQNGEFEIEKDASNNLIIHADNPEDVGSVTVVPK